MTGSKDNVGFLATGSGVQQFQLSSAGRSAFRRRYRLELTDTRSNLQAGPSPPQPMTPTKSYTTMNKPIYSATGLTLLQKQMSLGRGRLNPEAFRVASANMRNVAGGCC
jgi:hypothetical protein